MTLQNQFRIFDVCSFYFLKLWRWQPVAMTLLFCAVGWLGVGAIALTYYSERIAVSRLEVQRLQARLVASPAAARQLPVQPNDLPAFDSAAFTAEFQEVAQYVGLPIDEQVYVLESSSAQPYQRYRITMEVKAGYPELRKFVAAMSSAQPNVALDTLRCRRDDVSAPMLLCQLAFSAFFRKVGNG